MPLTCDWSLLFQISSLPFLFFLLFPLNVGTVVIPWWIDGNPLLQSEKVRMKKTISGQKMEALHADNGLILWKNRPEHLFYDFFEMLGKLIVIHFQIVIRSAFWIIEYLYYFRTMIGKAPHPSNCQSYLFSKLLLNRYRFRLFFYCVDLWRDGHDYEPSRLRVGQWFAQ